jgi:predicted nucleotidyltransferase
MNESIRVLISELKAGLVRLYGDRLKGVYLYGSYARGDQDRESDIDILIVLDPLDQYGKEVDRTSRLVSDLSLEYGLSISRVFVSEGDWLKQQTPFLVNAREEAIPA